MERPPVVRHVLPNGLTLLIQEEHTHPLVAFHVLVRTGSATEGEYLGTGISHVLEHVLFKGTERRPVGAVERESRSYGGTSQGFTTYDSTSFQLIVNREFWSQAADLMLDVLFFPRFDPAEFAKEREVVLRELKMRADDPDRLAWENLFANAYRVHPYRLPIIGLEPLMTQLTVEDAVRYHRRHYLPNTMVLAVVGDVEPQEVIRRIEELGKGIPPGREPLAALPEEPRASAPREVVEEADVNLGIAAIGFPGVALSDPDLFALDLLASLLGGGRGSRLEEALKETGIVHAVSCWSYTPQHPGLFGITLRADPERMEEAIQGAMGELARAREELFPQQKLEEIKRAMLRDYLAGRQTVGSQASDLATYEVLVGDPGFAHHYLEGVARTTPEDVRRAARRILDPGRATTVRILPRGALGSRREPAAAPAARPAAEKVTLENGLRVLLRPERRLPLVTLQVSLLGGVRYETPEDNGLSALTATLLTRGTSGKTAQEITDQVKRMGGHLETFSGRNSLGLTLEVLPSELPEGLALLEELLLESTFPPAELEKQKRLALANLKAQEEDPFSWGMRRLADTLFTRHPYRLHPSGSEPSLRRLRREEFTRFHGRVLHPERMVLSVVGDYDRQELLERLQAGLGRFRPRDPFLPAVPEEPPLTAPRERVEAVPRQEGLILIGFPGLPVRDPRVIPLDLAEAILSGGAGRLFHEVRERRGLAYAVGATALHGVDPGAFILYAIADPAQIDSVRRAMLEEVERLRAEPVPEKELQEVKQGLLGSRRIARQAQSVLAAQMASDELFGLGFDYARQYDARLQEITAEEVRQAVRELLDPARCVVVIGRPDAAEPAAASPEPEPAAVKR